MRAFKAELRTLATIQNMNDMDDLNSREAWNQSFSGEWQANRGDAQTSFFAKVFLTHLPPAFHALIQQGALSIVDWGCALGDALPLLRQAFPASPLSGLDISDVAIGQAQKRYPNLNYYCQSLAEFCQTHPRPQIIYTSNCLEHFPEPLEIMRTELFPYVEDYLMILVPFKEFQLGKGHLHSFDEQSFPRSFNTDPPFGLCFAQVINTAAYAQSHWRGQQLLLIYAHENSYGLQALMRQPGSAPASGPE